MARTIKFLIAVFLMMMFVSAPGLADDGLLLSNLVTPQNVEFNNCTRSYTMSSEKLFYMAIAAINANRFTIEEIQSKTGYILFTAVNKHYLATVVQIDKNKSMLKITPTNNNYFFAPGIVLNIFKYIDLNGSTPVVMMSN